MAIIYPSPVFGPVKSRRLGVSLGINLMPGDGKCCSFDCVYCECGLNGDHRPKQKMPSADDVSRGLEKKLKEMKEHKEALDVLTFSGNGEPTIHPQFGEIVDMVLSLRDIYYPNAKVSVISNSTQVHRDEVRNALMKVDNPLMKLDTVSDKYIKIVDRPTGKYDVNYIIENIARMNGHAIVQTMFMRGCIKDENGNMVSVDNCGNEYIESYIKALEKIRPRQVMIYTLDREWPVQGLEKADRETMDAIAEKIRAAGFNTSVSY